VEKFTFEGGAVISGFQTGQTSVRPLIISTTWVRLLNYVTDPSRIQPKPWLVTGRSWS
jgi:hypothetical protein